MRFARNLFHTNFLYESHAILSCLRFRICNVLKCFFIFWRPHYHPRRFAKSNILKQNFSLDVNDICDGSPSRILRVRRISFGITTRPRSSILLTIPVAFMIQISPFLFLRTCCVVIVCRIREIIQVVSSPISRTFAHIGIVNLIRLNPIK